MALWTRIAQRVRDDGWHILTDLITLGLGAESILISAAAHRWLWLLHSLPGNLLLGLVALGVAASIGRRRQEHRGSSLQQELQSREDRINTLAQTTRQQERLLQQAHRDYRAILEGQLALLADLLDFGDTERISLYKHEPTGHRFLELGRYSKHPEFRKTGRGIYPEQEGCIGRAWCEGCAYVSDLPDPAEDFNTYCRRLAREWKIPRLTVEDFTMKSRTVAAFAIDNPMGHHRVAVIVFESTQPNAFPLDRVREVLGAEVKRIRYFLEGMRPLEPSLDYASEEGF